MGFEVKKISLAMSLRTPQEDALNYLDKISTSVDYKEDDIDYIAKQATENCENGNKISFDFKFPSFCFDMTTGIGKTRLMGAAIYYLYKTKGYRHFFILTPGNTIYDKLRREALPEHPKYIFKGLESQMGTPKIYDGENYDKYKYIDIDEGKYNDIEIFIFNIGKIFSNKDKKFNFYKYQEILGSSFADILAKFDDLVFMMDEAHRYYAPASMDAINALRPILGLEFTATPKKRHNIIYSYGLNEGAGKFLKIPVVLGRTNMGGYSEDDIEQMKIIDGLTLHENRKKSLKRYCSDNNLPLVKPIVLIACKDTEHAKKIHELIESNSFFDGHYIGKVMEVHSKMSGDESEENIQKLLSIESTSNKIEIVLHVYKLKEGWDVNNLYTIIPLNAAKSDILALQTIGRGLRLPFGQITGDEEIDTLDIVCHDHYRELLDDIKNNKVFRTKNLDEDTETRKSVDVQTSLFDDFELSIIEESINRESDKVDLSDLTVQEKLYNDYVKTFAPKPVKKNTEYEKISLFELDDNLLTQEKKSEVTSEHNVEVQTSTIKFSGQKKMMEKEEFFKKINKYNNALISTPKILVTPTTKIEFRHFELKRTIVDFDIAASKIERYDAINKELLSSIDAITLKDDNPVNTLAIMLLESMSELSPDEAEFILDMVNQYLALIDGTDEDKQKIVRRYAKLIINDIVTQIKANIVVDTSFKYSVQQSYITFKKFTKNVINNGQQNYKKPFSDKKNIKKYIFDGYKKSYYPENSFDSDPERILGNILEDDQEVIKWIRLPLNQLGLFYKGGAQYNPDFLVETKDTKYMIEVKAANEQDHPDVLDKAKEGIKWCEYATQCDKDNKPWVYRLIIDGNIQEGNNFKYICGLAKDLN